MRTLVLVALSAALWQNAATAQTNDTYMLSADSSDAGDGTTATGPEAKAPVPEFKPLTASEKLRLYLTSTYGPGAIAKAAVAGGISQWRGTPKEWGGGAEAYGERVGNAFAIHVIRNTLEYGAATALHEDNRYVPSSDTGVWKRSRHAILSVFVARNDVGREHFAYSRFGGAVGASFISRIWQPQSTNSSGDAAVNFGIGMAADMGWNVFREFRPHHPKK